jgi:DnaJ-domain-containing protein 1
VELIAVIFMIVAGGALAVFVLIAVALNKRDAPAGAAPEMRVPERDRIAASLLFRVLTAGGTPPDEALREIRRRAGLLAQPASGIDIVSWGERYAQQATPQQRMQFLETAVQMIARSDRPVPLLQYVDLLDLSFSLGFQTDALAKLREQYGFDYIDHAKAARPRDADRAGTTTFFVREKHDPAEWLRVLGVEAGATRQEIIAAYRRLVTQHHPDKFHEASGSAREDAAARFIEITRAYEALLALYRD